MSKIERKNLEMETSCSWSHTPSIKPWEVDQEMLSYPSKGDSKTSDASVDTKNGEFDDVDYVDVDTLSQSVILNSTLSVPYGTSISSMSQSTYNTYSANKTGIKFPKAKSLPNLKDLPRIIRKSMKKEEEIKKKKEEKIPEMIKESKNVTPLTVEHTVTDVTNVTNVTDVTDVTDHESNVMNQNVNELIKNMEDDLYHCECGKCKICKAESSCFIKCIIL